MSTVSVSDDAIPAFGQVLLRLRRASGLSQADLARSSGMSVRALRDLERGRANSAQERSAAVLADALELTGEDREIFLLLAREGRRRTAKPVDSTMLHALPAVTELIGREEELRELTRLGTAVPAGVVVVTGPPGVGKTSLAVAAAHRLADAFPDGCLALDLGGSGDRPMAPSEALERMLHALGVPVRGVPESEADRVDLFRALLRDRRVLVLLDNAVDEAHVRPLLGTGSRGLTLVTCRRVLAGLAAASWVSVSPLPTESGVALLASITGDDVVRGEPCAATELVTLCGNLPLAIRIAGNRLATRPHWSLSYLVSQLRDERMRLSSLSAGDLQLRSAFEVSFRRLSPFARRVLRRLAVIPGEHFDEALAAVATGAPEPEVGALLDELVEASLLDTARTPGRLRFHNLLRLFAAERLAQEEPEEERELLRDRTLRHLLGMATAAGAATFHRGPAGADGSPFHSQEHAGDWLVREGTNWSAAQREAAALGWHTEVLGLAKAMHWFADSQEFDYRWDEVYRLGLEAARHLGDQVAEVDMLNQLGWAQYLCRNDNELALRTNSRALALAEEIGDHRGRVFAHCYIGVELTRLGQGEKGMAHLRTAHDLSAEYDFFELRYWVCSTLGVALQDAGRYGDALAVHQALLTEACRHRDEAGPEVVRWVMMLLMENIGLCLAGLGRWREAAASHHEARRLCVENEAAHREADQAIREGLAWRAAGEPDRARCCLLLARELLDGPVYRTDRERVDAELAGLTEHRTSECDEDGLV
ncbi:helix-turn-helix domain-containing protein [Lentzea aerocolonigenes]|uniref:helix-turn-helix domain-containing protein n=1 Tax=Lentzea aerocolonigenes TaxID=68170 RepID=UPI0005EC92B3|nr:helix-turn-helix domain-containing protein [Lentzea aerocolonigenes]